MTYTSVFTDDFTASNGTTWDAKWYTGFSTATEEPKVSSNQGKIVTAATANRYGAGTCKIAAGDSRATTEYLATITKDSASRQYMLALGVNTNGANGSSGGKFVYDWGVWIETPGDGTGITIYAKGSGGTTVSTTSSATWAVGASRKVRLRYDGTNVYLKVWTGTEPTAWTDTWTPSVSVSSGFTFFGVHASASGASLGATNGVFIDDVRIGDGAGVVETVAPVATGSGDAVASTVTTTHTYVDNLTTYTSGHWTKDTDVGITASSGSNFLSATVTGTPQATYTRYGKAAGVGERLILVAPVPIVSASTTNGIQIGEVLFTEAGTVVDKDSGTGSVTFELGQWYYIRTNWSGSDTKVTVWRQGSPEPSPQFTRSAVTGTQNLQFVFKNSAASSAYTYIDKFTINDTGSTIAVPEVPATVTAPVATGSGEAVAPTVSASGGTVVNAVPMTGGGAFPAPAAFAKKDVVVTVTPATADGEFAAGVFAQGIHVDADPLIGSGSMPDVTVTALLSAIVNAEAATGSAQMMLPVEFQGSENDPYFQRVSTQVDSDDWWFRLDETSGAVVVNEIPELPGGNETDGSYVGSPTFAVGAPEGRRYVSLSGSGQYIQFPTNDRLINEWSFEVTFRTTKQNQVITGAFDNIVGNFGITGTPSFLETSGGKLKWLGQTGLKTVSDGQWHHVVLWVKNDVWRFYIDGRLDIQRFKGSGPTSTPDTFGGPGTYLDGSVQKTADIATGTYFQGDVMEIVQRHNYALDPTDITRNFYAVFGIVPKEAPTATGSAVMPSPKVKGNTKRAIVVYSGININQSTGHYDETTWDASTGDFDFGPFISSVGNTDLAGYKFFPVRLTNVNLKDEVTDLQRFIDFTTDVDLSDIDLIVFRDVPDEGYERAALLNVNVSENVIVGQNYIEQAWERMILSLRAAVDSGVSLLVTSPRLATDLGIISTAQVHTQGREALFGAQNQGNATGSYDYRAAAITPFGSDTGHSPEFDGASPSEINTLARYYFDTHRINRYRVTATVTGLTDIPAYIRTDTVNFTPSDNFRIGKFADKFAYRPDGLLIGDEFLIDYLREGAQLRDYLSAGFLDRKARRDSFVLWSVPPEGVKAGTVVTRLASKYWVGIEEVDNPYADNATTIVLEPGDPLNGTPVGGKVFVNFTEEPIFTKPDYQKQLVTPGDETAEQLAWDYSGWRWTVQYTSVGTPGQSQGSGTADEANVGTEPSTQLSTVSLYEKYPVVSLNVETMMTRGLTWLGDRAVSEGATVIRVPAMQGTMEMKAPNSTAGRSVTIGVDAALGAATMTVPQGLNKDVTVTTFPATGSATMPTLPTIIHVSPATGSGTMTAFNAIAAGGEQVVVYLYNTEATLFIKEEN